MTDPTEFVLVTCFLAALGIFVGSAVARRLVGGNSAPAIPSELFPQDPDSPYQTPVFEDEETPPLIRLGTVPTHVYRTLDLLGVGLIYLLFFGLVIGSVRAAQDSELVLNPVAIASSIGFQFFLAGIAILMMARRINPIDWLGLRWPRWPWVFLIAPCTVFGMWMIFGALQFGGYMEWIESLGVESVQDTVKLLQESTDPLLLGLMAFAAVIAAPLCEEIVFRGYLYPVTKRFAGPWAAGVCSALVFAAAHGSLSALLPLFIFGIVLVVIYEKTGSLWAPVAVHLCFNGATVVVQMAVRFLDIPVETVP